MAGAEFEPSDWVGPRTVIVPRTDQGFGFTLRHFIVYPPDTRGDHSEGEDTDQDGSEKKSKRTKLSGLEPIDTIFVKNVKENSPADHAGLKPRDRIVSVNAEPVTGKSYSQVISLIQSSETALKLLVVPKDEDILQLFYQAQAQECMYNSSGSLEAPERSATLPRKSYKELPPSENVRHSDTHESKISFTLQDHRDKEYAFPSRSWDHGPYPLKTSSSYGSALSSCAEPLRSDSSYNREAFVHDFGLSHPPGHDNVNMTSSLSSNIPAKKYSFGLYFPPKPSDNKSSSMEALGKGSNQRYSKENIRDSNSELRPRRLGYEHRQPSFENSTEKSQSKESLLRAQERLSQDSKPPVYTSTSKLKTGDSTSVIISRSHTTSSLSSPANSTSQSPYRSQVTGRRGSDMDFSAEGHGVRRYVPVVSSAPIDKVQKASSVDNIDSRLTRYQTQRSWHLDSNRYREDNSKDGALRSVCVRIPVGEGSFTNSDGSDSTREKGSGTTFAVTRSPVSTQIEIKKTPRQIVSHRKQQFELGKNENHSPGLKFDRCKTELAKIQSFRKFESVANRAAIFETKQDSIESENEAPQPADVTPVPNVQPAVKVRKISAERYGASNVSKDKPDRPTTLASYHQESAPIRIYVSPGSSSAPSSPLVEIVQVFQDGQPKLTTSVSHDPSRQITFTHSASEEVVDDVYPQARIIQENIHGNRPVRKTSYLSAVNAPRSRYSQEASDDDDEDVDDEDTVDNSESPSSMLEPLGSSAGSLSLLSTFSNTHSVMSASDGGVVLSKNEGGSVPPQYHNVSLDGVSLESAVQLRAKNTASPETEAQKLHRRTSYLMATARDRSNQQPLEKSFSPSTAIPETQMSTPPRNPSINKLKNFFGEKTPSILEATEGKMEPPESPLADVVKEGWLACKTTVTDGKKSSDRSWKEVWVVLRGHCLFLFKERRDANTPFNFTDEKPISIKFSVVDIKHEYAKRKKHVFQLTTYNGSEYLFQAEDKGTMLLWIQAIKSNNNPDCDDEGVCNADLIRRKSSQAELSTGSKTSPTAPHKISKKHSTISLRKTASPNVKRKKSGADKDSKSKGWKERIMPSFKKHHDNNSSTALNELDEDCMKTAFGVSLEHCMPSPDNEYIPLIVELCTKIVELRGLEVVGVYRVPGNSVAVQNMQEEFNKGIENMNIYNEKWLDVNVISSLLKAFFRKLPEPLVTNQCYNSFIEANRFSDPEKRFLKLKRCLHTLPEHHFETFKRMAEHLNKVAAFGHINKMNAKNLATMFGPTLIRRSDDDTISMVADMSDQCHIVESIIVNFDWYFGSWEDDHTVPSEEVSEPPTTTDSSSRVLRDDDEDLDSVINTREIVSSIISAANKKLQSKQNQKSMDSLDFDESFNERDIDLAISRKNNEAKMSKSQSTISSVPSSRSISEEFLDRKLSSSTMKSMPQSSTDADSVDFDYIDAKKEKMSSKSYSSGSFSRHYSDESLLDRNDELEISHGMSSTWSLSQDILDRLKRIEVECVAQTRALREWEERRQRHIEQRRLEQQRIEQEYLRTKKEMEIEESHSVEDLLNWRPDFPPDVRQYVANSEHPDPRAAVSHKYYSSAESSHSGGTSDSKVKLRKQDRQAQGGKYFVVANTRGRSKEKNSARGAQGSLDSLAPRFSRAGSLENILDSHGHMHPTQSHQRGPSVRRRDAKRDSHHEHDRRNVLSRGSSLRHGSLDSLIDMIDKQDDRASWASSDSEDGSDLLRSLTTTFDQKLQILLNPKYKLSGNRRVNRPGDVSDLEVEDAVEDKDQDVEKTEPPKHPPVTLPQFGEFSRDRPFRDPSLHRSSKSETKIGIASRFERGSHVPTSSASAVLPVSSSPQAMQQNRRLSQEGKSSPFKFSPKAGNEAAGAVVLTQPKKLEKPSLRTEFRPISKSEKTEVNSTLARLSREEKYLSGRDTSKPVLAKPCRSESPADDKKRTKRSKRRHTVGGMDDLEHFKALISVSGQKDAEPEPKVSAWEQLQPAVKETNVPENRSLLVWIKNERLRGSTPDLSSETKH